MIRRLLESLGLARPRMISCREFEEFIGAYFDGGLAPRERAVFDAHLAVCRACQQYLAAYRRTGELVRAVAADDPVPDDVPEELIHAILAAKRG